MRKTGFSIPTDFPDIPHIRASPACPDTRLGDGGIGCGRADDDGDDEDDNGGYGGGKSDNVTTVTGTVAMGLAVWARVAGDETGIGDGGKSDGDGATRDDAKTSLHN